MKCKECGQENIEDAKFCRSCGSILSTEPSKEITLVSDQLNLEERLIKNRFKVIKKLGKGGMGEVLLAEDLKLKRKIAIKSILTNTLTDTSSKARFLREAQTASRLDHPNICTIYEVYEENYHDYIVMQYVDGVTIDQIIKLKPLSVNKTMDIALQVCRGMVEAHDHGVIHRDIKPGNIMVDRKGVVKILDFGLAKFGAGPTSKADRTEELNLTEKGIVLGTVSYLSPEQASGKPVDHQTDVFSFGILLFEMVEGRNPFKEEEQIETLYNVLNKDVEFQKKLPERLKQIIRKTLEKDKKKRYAGFSQLKDDLEAFHLSYTGLKEEPQAGGGTEVINYREQEKLLKEIQKTSDNEGLGDLVYKIKKFKASTERVSAAGRKKIKWIGLPIVLVILLLVGGYFIVNKIINDPYGTTGNGTAGTDSQFYVYLHPFKNNTGEKKLPEKLNYLLTESLNQFKEFKVINEEEAASILEMQEDEKVDIQKLSGKFKVKHELEGEISYRNGFYTIEGRLSRLDNSLKEKRLTITGKGKDSFLINQVDNLSKRVYKIFFPTTNSRKLNFKKVSGIYGTDWTAFSNFYRGYLYKKKLENDKARKYLLKANEILISKYYLAGLFYFEGSRTRASTLVNEMVSHIKSLTEPLKFKVLALKARLDLDFGRQIKNLEKLKNDFQFSKEVFFELGEAYFHHGNAEKALGYYKKALELNRNYSKALNHMGYCYSYLGEHGKAIEAFEEYRTLDQTANSFDSLGDGYFYEGEYVDSENLKGLAVNTDEKSVAYSYLTLADINILKARYREAVVVLRKYRRLRNAKKNVAAVLAKQAYIYYVDRDYDRALQTINRSLEEFDQPDVNDNTSEAHWVKGLILLALNNNEDSHLELDWLEKFKDRYRLSETNFSAPFKYYVHLDALLMEREGQIAEAEKNFKFLVGMKPRLCYWTTYYHYQFFHTEYAAFLVRNKRYEDALREIEQCLEYNGNYIPALWGKSEILEKTDDLQRINIYHKIAELYGESTEKNYLRNLLKEKLK